MSQFHLLDYETATDVYNTGWIPPAERKPAVAKAVAAVQAAIPLFSSLRFAVAELPKKVVLNTLQADAIKRFEQFIPASWLFDTTIDGKPVKLLKNIQQNSGSCVGTRHTRYAFDHMLYEAFWLNEPEKIIFPYTMFHYANGRKASGINGKGEGSTGTGQAKALCDSGIIAFDYAGLPAVQIGNEIEWTGQQEIQYSTPSAFPQAAFTEGKKHLFGEAVRIDSTEAARTVIASGRSLVFCSDIGFGMEAPMKGGLRYFARRSATWHHCWGIDGYWTDHPELGEIYHLTNNWGEAHGDDPTTGDAFGFWVPKSVVEYILSGDETYAFLDLAGFPDELRKRSQFFDLVY